jgi:glucuronokinase
MARAEIARSAAHSRVALAGNPSDGYGGAVVACTVADLGAQAVARPASAIKVTPSSELVQVTIARFARELHPPAASTEVSWSTSIPRGVGLGGSSAIVIATLRALCELYRVRLTEAEMAELALAVEVEELGITAGLQDRVAQCFGGVVFMDFDPGHQSYERLDPERMPPLLVAWRSEAGTESGSVHAPLRDRYLGGEPVVVESLRELGRLGRAARAAIDSGDSNELARCVDQSFDARERMLPLDPRHVAMIACARGSGASANYAGSGGAIVAVCVNLSHRARVERELRSAGCQTLMPTY